MRNYAKAGTHRGRVAYRTPATFRVRKHLATIKEKSRQRSGKVLTRYRSGLQ